MTERRSYTLSQINILLALEKYRFLTTQHMIQLGISKNKSSLSNYMVAPLKTGKNPPIKYNYKVTSSPAEGRLHNFYYLTETGAKEVAERMNRNIKDIIRPISDPRFAHDYFHRFHYISFWIEFEKFFNRKTKEGADITDYYIEKSYHYMDKKRVSIKIDGNDYGSSDLVYYIKENEDDEGQKEVIETDGLFLTNNMQDQDVYMVEVHRSPNTQDILSQIHKRIESMRYQAIYNRFGIEKNGYLLSVSTKESTLKNILNRIQMLPSIQAFEDCVFFTSIERVKKDFANAWIDFRGGKVNIFNEL